MTKQNRDIVIRFRITQSEKEELEKLAEKCHMKMSEYIRYMIFVATSVPQYNHNTATMVSKTAEKVPKSTEKTTLPKDKNPKPNQKPNQQSTPKSTKNSMKSNMKDVLKEMYK